VPGHDIRHAVANARSSAPGSDRVLYTGSTADGNGFLEVVVLDNIEPNCAHPRDSPPTHELPIPEREVMTIKNCTNPTSLSDEQLAEIVAETEEWLDNLDLSDPNVEITYTPLAAPFLRVGEAMRNVEAAERELVEAVGALRDAGYSWTVVANVLGVSRQAARQRFGTPTRGRRSA
jgi:hypothetical protein